MQLQARARSPGVESNPTMPDAANIAREVLAAITPTQQQMILEQQRLEERLATMMVSQKETLDSQMIALSTEVRRTRTEIQESMRSANPIEQSQTSWRATSPAYIQPPQMMPRQQVQPWEIPAGSPRAPFPPRDRPQNERASLEWNMIMAVMTCRAKQKEDYDIQGSSIDSNANWRRIGLPIEDAGRLDIHRTGSVRLGAALPLHHTETARRLMGGSHLPVPAMPGGVRVPEYHRMQSGSESDAADKSMAARCVSPTISNTTIAAGGVIHRPPRRLDDEDDHVGPGGSGGPGVLVFRHQITILLRLLGFRIVERKISMADLLLSPLLEMRKVTDLAMVLKYVLWRHGFLR